MGCQFAAADARIACAVAHRSGARQMTMPQPEEGLDEGTDVTNWNRSRSRHRVRDGADLSSGSALDVRDGKDYILCLARSERLGPGGPLGRCADCDLLQGKSKRSPLWRAARILGVALMNRSNRIDHIR